MTSICDNSKKPDVATLTKIHDRIIDRLPTMHDLHREVMQQLDKKQHSVALLLTEYTTYKKVLDDAIATTARTQEMLHNNDEFVTSNNIVLTTSEVATIAKVRTSIEMDTKKQVRIAGVLESNHANYQRAKHELEELGTEAELIGQGLSELDAQAELIRVLLSDVDELHAQCEDLTVLIAETNTVLARYIA